MNRLPNASDFALILTVLVWLFSAWILVWTVAFTAPTFAALQQRGIQKNASVASKLPYRSSCVGRTCKNYVLRVSFFTGVDGQKTTDLGGVSITLPEFNLGKLVFAELEVTEAEYNATTTDDKKRIVFLEEKPEEVWLAARALAWQPLGNYLSGLGLLLLGGVLFGLHRRLRPPPPTRGGRL
jgi:hypothetical protein